MCSEPGTVQGIWVHILIHNLGSELRRMTNGNLTHWSNNHMSGWQEVKNYGDVCGNTKSFNLPYKRRKHRVWFTSQLYHTRIQRITAEILECNGARLSLTTLHSLFPLPLFFSLFTSFLSSQRLCRKCTLKSLFLNWTRGMHAISCSCRLHMDVWRNAQV